MKIVAKSAKIPKLYFNNNKPDPNVLESGFVCLSNN